MGPPELIIIGIIAIAVIFGAKKIPEIARNVGRSSGEFKKGLKEGDEMQASTPPVAPPPPSVTPPSVTPPSVTPPTVTPPTVTPATQPVEPTDPPPTQI